MLVIWDCPEIFRTSGHPTVETDGQSEFACARLIQR